MILLSFVIPCYRSAKTIRMVVDEIITIVSKNSAYDYEIICVNDASPDQVYDILVQMAKDNKKIKVINFAKNMGKHSAVLAGYAVTKGAYVVNLDDDYQCPIYELWRLLEPLEKQGYDMATAVYKIKKESLIKRLGSHLNTKMAEWMIHQPSGLRLENFSILKRYIVEEVVKYPNPYPYINGLILQVTHNIKMVPMEERERGDDNMSGFTMNKSISLFFNGFTAFSVLPLRIASVGGFVFSLLGIMSAVFFVIRKILNPDILMGYSSLGSILLFTSGIIMMILGMIGEYIGRIYICLNKAPQYVVRDTINI